MTNHLIENITFLAARRVLIGNVCILQKNNNEI